MPFRVADRDRGNGTIAVNRILINKIEKMKVKKVLTLAIIAVCCMGMVACTAETKKTEQVMAQEKTAYQKKYTNADFYKDGKFDQEAAKKPFLICLIFMEFLLLH